MTRPHVTIVVCTYNRAGMLRDAVGSLLHLETEGRFTYEVLVVDNASSDHTPTVIAELAAKAAVHVRGVREIDKGVACARNRGIVESRGEWVAFFDDDQLADPRWLMELMDMAEERWLRCAGGAVHLRLPEDCTRELAPLCRGLLGESYGMPREMPYSRRESPGTGNLLVRRDVFDKVGVFDESLSSAGEDTDWFRRVRRAGIEAWYTPRAIVHHVIPAYRLEADHLHWTALRIGGHLARRERLDYGRALFPLVLLGRLAQLALIAAPKSAFARFAGDSETALGAACGVSLWRGYLRTGLALVLPGCFDQADFFAKLSFRSEPRQQQQLVESRVP